MNKILQSMSQNSRRILGEPRHVRLTAGELAIFAVMRVTLMSFVFIGVMYALDQDIVRHPAAVIAVIVASAAIEFLLVLATSSAGRER